MALCCALWLRPRTELDYVDSAIAIFCAEMTDFMSIRLECSSCYNVIDLDGDLRID